MGLSHALYETPPAYRAEFLQRLILEARGNAELRRLVTVRALLRSWGRNEGTGRLHIAHVLDHFCREVYGLRSFKVVDPNYVIPTEEALAFPAEYFGPDAPPVYEDGSLKRRPCPWATRNVQSAPHHYSGEHEGHLSGTYVHQDAEEFLAGLRSLRAQIADRPGKPLERTALARLEYAEDIGIDANINAPLWRLHLIWRKSLHHYKGELSGEAEDDDHLGESRARVTPW
jgi:hypothetical protein